jgi:uncharacterized protein
MILSFLSAWVHALLEMTLTIAPLLLLGLFIAGVLHLFLGEEQVSRLLGGRKKRSVFLGTFLAIPLPLCSCSVVPVVASLRKKGAAPGPSVSFLVAAPQIGADSFLLTQGLLGWPFAIARILASFVTALMAGLAESFSAKNDLPIAPRPPLESNQSLRSRLKDVISHVDELLASLANNLLLGLVLAALIMVLLPESALQNLLAGRDWLGRILMLLAGIPLYVCATASTPIAAALVLKGISPGAALVFLLTGPATNIMTLVLLKDSLGKRPLLIYLTSIASVALLAGWIMDVFAPSLTLEYFQSHVMDHGPAVWSLLATLILGILLLRHYITVFRPKKMVDTALSLSVAGMTCSHCAGRVETAALSLPEIREASVDLDAGCLNVVPAMGAFDDETWNQLRAVIEEAGFKPSP